MSFEPIRQFVRSSAKGLADCQVQHPDDQPHHILIEPDMLEKPLEAPVTRIMKRLARQVPGRVG